MPRLLNQFDLNDGVSRKDFEQAWDGFVDQLMHTGLAFSSSPLCLRRPDSGYDTDDQRTQKFMAVIEFRDDAQADAAWAAIEERAEPLGHLHRQVISMCRIPFSPFGAKSDRQAVCIGVTADVVPVSQNVALDLIISCRK